MENCKIILSKTLVLIKHIFQECKNVTDNIERISYDFNFDFHDIKKAHKRIDVAFDCMRKSFF